MLESLDFELSARVRIENAGGGTQFTCFTGTKVQILTQKALLGGVPAKKSLEEEENKENKENKGSVLPYRKGSMRRTKPLRY